VTASPIVPEAPADETPVVQTEVQEDVPDWLKTNSFTSQASQESVESPAVEANVETAEPAGDIPDWLK
jgi:hypothetical protein